MSKNQKKSKNILLVVVLLAIVGIAVGYAALSQTLTLNGTATVETGKKAWNVHFVSADTKVKEQNKANDAEITITEEDGVEGTFSATLQPGESVSYDVVIKNDGSIDAEFDKTTITPEVDESGYVTCTIDEAEATTNPLLTNGDTHSYVVTLSCADISQDDFEALDDDGITAEFTVDFLYNQSTKSDS